MPNPKPNSPAEEYAMRLNQLTELMRAFDRKLANHYKAFQKDQNNWAYAGDLQNYIEHFETMLGRRG
jgi:hypothetical protein